MINLFKKDETSFGHNGLGSLDKNILNPEINWKDNGAFTLEFKYPLFAKHGFEIENSSVVRANDQEGTNLFFVYKITPSMGYVTVLCYQISYKLAFNSINDTNIVNKSGQNALAQMSNATQYPHSFMFSSDIQTTATSRVVRKNPIEFLLDTGLDNSFINRWGGHIVRHGFNIAMNSAYGSNKGYTIRHKKDLKGYEAEFDESTVITRIRPVGYDGLLLPELYVDSSLINNYVEPRIQQIEYSNVKVKTKDSDEEGFSTKELAYAELRRLANLEFSKNKVDLPTFTSKVEFVNLKDTAEYQDLKSLKQILAGDIVKVVHSEDNFSIEAQMVEYKWNPLNQSYISIVLGNYTKSFTSTVSKVSSLQTNLSQIAQQAQSAWSAANGKNTVYSLTYKPAITGSSVEGDLLYLKNGDKIEMWILEKVNGELQWVLQVSDATQEELKAQMAQAKNDINSAVDKANAAVDKANASVTAVQAAKIDIDKALNDSTSALDAIKVVDGRVDSVTTTIANVKVDVDKKADKTIVASQISQSATQVKQDVQSWTDNKLTAYSTTLQTDSSITNAVASKADKSQITQLSGQITSTVTSLTNETLITTQMIQSATLKHPNYPDMLMVEVPVTNGETYTVSSNMPNRGTATAAITDVFYLRLPETIPNSNINGAFEGKSITLPAISDKIYIVFRSRSVVDNVASGQYWVKVTKTPASQSQITQLSDNINLRVSKGNVTSQINIEAGRTLIDTKQLLLNANTVKFSGSAFIPNSVIQNLSADKITAGTLNAANVNVINLNASNMSTGTISGSNLSINLNSGEVSFRKGRLFSEKMEVNITDGYITQSQQFGTTTMDQGVWRFKDNDGGQTQMAPLRRNSWVGFGFEANRIDGGSGTNYMSLSDNFYVDAESVFKKKVYVNNDLSFDSLTSSYAGAFRVRSTETYIGSLTLETNRITVKSQYDALEIQDNSNGYKSVSAKAFNTMSLKKLKTDIHKLNFDAINEIKKTDIRSFRYLNDNEKTTIGAIIGDGYSISNNILSADKTSVDLYSMVSIAWNAIKQQQKQIDKLRG